MLAMPHCRAAQAQQMALYPVCEVLNDVHYIEYHLQDQQMNCPKRWWPQQLVAMIHTKK